MKSHKNISMIGQFWAQKLKVLIKGYLHTQFYNICMNIAEVRWIYLRPPPPGMGVPQTPPPPPGNSHDRKDSDQTVYYCLLFVTTVTTVLDLLFRETFSFMPIVVLSNSFNILLPFQWTKPLFGCT